MYATQTVCLYVALGIHHSMRMRHFISCDLPSTTVLFHVIS